MKENTKSLQNIDTTLYSNLHEISSLKAIKELDIKLYKFEEKIMIPEVSKLTMTNVKTPITADCFSPSY